MNLHLIGGFLGSGKTTAIIQAAKVLLSNGKKVGVLTNDQGKYLVDSAFFQLSNIPTVEVGGGCFCCNYDDMDDKLDQLVESVSPDVIFAESVGSCADLVATVIKPLLIHQSGDSPSPTSFSVFTDIRLVRHWLAGDTMPFSDQIVYIFEKQMEEAGLIVLNKIDLVPTQAWQEVISTLQQHFPTKHIMVLSALDREQVSGWLDLIETKTIPLPETSLDLDYQVYGQGEANLAWLDEEIQFDLQSGNLNSVLMDFIGNILEEVRTNNIPIGHLKFLGYNHAQNFKLTFSTLDDFNSWETSLPDINDAHLSLVVNARLETDVTTIRTLFRDSIDKCTEKYPVRIHEDHISTFHPKFPQPTYRMP